MNKSLRTRARLAWWIAAGVAALAQVALASVPLADTLSHDVRRLIDSHKFGKARVGVSIMDGETGEVLAAVSASDPFTPASNMKILTSGAALMVLGPDFAFRTELALVDDRLIVRGSGDPALADPVVLQQMEPKMTVADVLDALAGAVVQAAISRVDEVVVDDRVFDREYVHPAWPVDQLNRGYCAEVCGANFHANILSFFPRPNPDGAGTPAHYSLEPQAPWIQVDVKARTVPEGRNSAWVTREKDDNRFTLRGDVRFPTQVPVEATLHSPGEFFGRLLEHRLTGLGVKVGGQGRAGIRLADEHEQFGEGKVLAVVRTPIAQVLQRCNSDSENLYAESLLKKLGNAVTKEPGSWSNGASVLRMIMTEHLGAEMTAGTTISDGSGLSRQNLVSPATLARWLYVLASDPKTRDAFAQSLAKPGVGTLKRRFAASKLNNEVRGKSGFINGVRCLSGYVIEPATGERITFSVMVNDISTDDQTREALTLHEEVVELIDEYITKQSAVLQPRVGG